MEKYIFWYKAVMMSCIYDKSQVKSLPVAVSMTTQPCSAPRFLVRVHNKEEVAATPKVNFTVCLSGPMKFGYADVGQFVQWMEFNKKMGVERFVLYNHSVDAALRPYLVYYAQKGDMQLFPWIVPASIPNPLVYLKNLGHLAMLNDCLYRNMYTTKYIAYMDVDELIIPRAKHSHDWKDIIKDKDCIDKPQTIIKSVFFRREWPSDETYATNETVTKLGLVALMKTKREKKIWPAFMRSKYFVMPTHIEACNVHNTHRFMNDKDGFSINDTCVLEPKQALLQHYRYWGEVTGSYVVDTKAHEYADFFINSVKAVYEDVLQKKFTLT